MWRRNKGKAVKGQAQGIVVGQTTVDDHESLRTPNQAWLNLDDGGTIPCAILEDPQRTGQGYRQFWLEPVRALRDGERAIGVYIDVLPGLSQANVRWPDNGHHLHPDATFHMSWQDREGNAYTSDAGMDLLWEDPPEQP